MPIPARNPKASTSSSNEVVCDWGGKKITQSLLVCVCVCVAGCACVRVSASVLSVWQSLCHPRFLGLLPLPPLVCALLFLQLLEPLTKFSFSSSFFSCLFGCNFFAYFIYFFFSGVVLKTLLASLLIKFSLFALRRPLMIFFFVWAFSKVGNFGCRRGWGFGNLMRGWLENWVIMGVVSECGQ